MRNELWVVVAVGVASWSMALLLLHDLQETRSRAALRRLDQEAQSRAESRAERWRRERGGVIDALKQ